jgi:hypothetical protein
MSLVNEEADQLTIHLNLASKLRLSRVTPPLSHTHVWDTHTRTTLSLTVSPKHTPNISQEGGKYLYFTLCDQMSCRSGVWLGLFRRTIVEHQVVYSL